MDIYPTCLTSDTLDITELFEVSGAERSPICLKVGTAEMPNGLRHPEYGMSAHDQDEISIVLEGGFLLETAKGEFRCKKGDVIHIPAGEEHASTAIDNGKVFYVLFG